MFIAGLSCGGDQDNAEDQGLIAQGLRGRAELIGLGKGFEPLRTNRNQRIKRAAALLGALAFEMFAWTNPKNEPEPQFGSVKLDLLLKRVAARMEAAGQGTLDEFDRDFDLLKDMNIHALDYLLFREADEEHLAFHDRTTQAFFAAYWACNCATAEELQDTRRWVVDDLFEKNREFREFWQFAAEMPDQGLPEDNQGNVDEGGWRTLFEPLYDGSVQDAEGRPIRSTEFIYRSWQRMEGSAAGRRIIAEKYCIPSIPDDLLAGFIPLVGSGKPQDTGTFRMGEDQEARIVTMEHFLLHQYCVTNLEYELFDPRHKEIRWYKGNHPAVEETGDHAADDACPVVMVSWYDCWCFAKFLGRFERKNGRESRLYEMSLPGEAQWEYACRAGQDTPFTFDQSHDGQSVSEWCEDLLGDLYILKYSYRVYRYGGWYYFGRYGRSAKRWWGEPAYRVHDRGFRLAAVPVGARQAKLG